MPFVKVAGKWVAAAEGSTGDIVPQRLVIVDKQVDGNGSFGMQCLSDCRVTCRTFVQCNGCGGGRFSFIFVCFSFSPHYYLKFTCVLFSPVHTLLIPFSFKATSEIL